MENGLTIADKDVIQRLVLDGDLSRMSQEQKVLYYNQFCNSLGLNPLTQPFQIIKFQGKEKLYATKDCTEQLRKIHGVSITDVTATELRGVYVVTAKAIDKTGKTDASTGVVTIEGLKGDALANALMKAETKSKRRVTLSICGLGILDETETETIKGAVTEDIPHVEIKPTNTSIEIKSGDAKKDEGNHTMIKQGTKPWLNPGTKEWENAFTKIHTGHITLDDVLAHYRISKDNSTNILNPKFEYHANNNTVVAGK